MKAAVAVDYDKLVAGVRRLSRVDPDRARAVVKIVQFYLTDVKKEAKADRVRRQKRSLDTRLAAAHRCETDRFEGFTQLPPFANGSRAWRCNGCGASVELGEKVGA